MGHSHLVLFIALFLQLRPFAASSLSAGLETYRSLLQTHPLRTNMLTAACITVTSDAISQAIERKQQLRAAPLGTSSVSKLAPSPAAAAAAAGRPDKLPNHDLYRSATMAIYGAVIFGAFVTWWFTVLSKLVPVTDLLSVVRKVFVNQFFMSPFLNALFFLWVSLTRNPSDKELTLPTRLAAFASKLRTDLVPTILRSCVYWTIFNLANFSLVPPRNQVLCTSLGFLVWTCYLSFVGYRNT